MVSPPCEAGDGARGWQRAAGAAIEQHEFEVLYDILDPAERALLLSQAGTHASRAFTTAPTTPAFSLDNAHFRIILLRRLRLPLGLAPATCRCGGALDPL